MPTKNLFLILLLLLSTACSDEVRYGSLSDAPQGEVNYGGIFRIKEVEAPGSLFPLSIKSQVSRHVAGQVYEGLVRPNPADLSPMPALAEKWIINADATSFIFFIRKGVKFHDDKAFASGKGRELTAHDVKYCFDQLCTDSPQNMGFWIFRDRVAGANSHFELSREGELPKNGVSGIKVLNNYAIQIDLKYPFPEFLNVLSMPFAWIYPKEARDYYGEKMSGHCLGTGPFKIKKLKKNKSMLLVANKDYWGFDAHGNRLPYLSALKFSFKGGKEKAVKEFREGKLEMLFGHDATFMGDSAHGFTEQNTSGLNLLFLWFQNQAETSHNKNLKQALSHAINVQGLVDEELHGRGIPAGKGLISDLFYKSSLVSVKKQGFDPVKAKQFLVAAGYPDGAGFPETQLIVEQFNENMHVAKAIANMLKENLNIEVTIREGSFIDFREAQKEGKAFVFLGQWTADYPFPENFLSGMNGHNITKDSIALQKPARPVFVSQVYDSLVKQGLREGPGESRNKFFEKAEQLLLDEAPIIPLLHKEHNRYLQPYVRNFPINAIELRDFSRVWLEKGAK